MQKNWFTTPINRRVVIIFWLVVLVVFLSIYFFAPSVYNQMRQESYQDTPFVDTPSSP